MSSPHLVCVLEGTGEPIFSSHTFDHRMQEGDLFQYTTGGAATSYKVESVVLEVESKTGDTEATTHWTTFVQRVTASIVIGE